MHGSVSRNCCLRTQISFYERDLPAVSILWRAMRNVIVRADAYIYIHAGTYMCVTDLRDLALQFCDLVELQKLVNLNIKYIG